MAENNVAVKLPTFWPDNVETWFSQAEAQFRLRNITQDETKFSHVAAVLDMETATAAEEILNDPPATDKYKALKELLIETYGLSDSERAERILAITDLGARKPSQLMTHMLHLYGPQPEKLLLRHIFLRALPEELRQALASYKEKNLRDLAKEADRVAPMVSRQAAHANEAAVDAVQQQQQQKRWRKKGLCFFHWRFGPKSRKCESPCTWNQGNGDAGRQ